jgi:hypothetical protein
MGETAISKASRDEIRKLGVPCERVQSGRRGKRFHCAGAGTPDTWTALGWIEFKQPWEELNDDQKRWHARAKAWGVRVAVSHSVSETIAIIRGWLREKQFEERMGWL